MKTILLSLLTALLIPSARGEGTIFVSTVDGVQYEATLDSEAVRKTGGVVSYRKDRTNYLSEPKGIPLREAMEKADAAAKRILGEGLSGDDPRWVLKSAERAEAADEAGYYYHFSYSTRDGAYSSPEGLGPAGNLQIFVLLDGTVVEPKRVEAKK